MTASAQTDPTDAAAGTPDDLRDVFLCHASQDGVAANSLVGKLEAAGLRCWIAPRDVTPGVLYAEAILKAINGTRVLVVLLSKDAVASPHVGKEIERASSKRHPIIAIRTDSTPLPPAFEYFLSESHWLEAAPGNVDSIAPKLVQAVRELRGTAPGVTSISLAAPTHPVLDQRRPILVGALVTVLLSIGAFAITSYLKTRPAAGAHEVATGANTISDNSIAVLPFVDLSEKKDQEYFADGLAEETLNRLAKLPAIKVIGRTSSFQFKNHSEDLRSIGTKLGVAYILEGSLRKSGDQVRVSAQLNETRTGTRVWSATYERGVGDAFRLQDEIANAIVRALQITVGADELNSGSPPTSAAAHDLYLRGRHAMDRFDSAGLDEATNYFHQALDADSTFADAAAALSLAYEMQASSSLVPIAVGFEQSRAAANAALNLNPKLALPHAILGMIHVHYDWDWAAADREIQAALKLAPYDPLVLGVAGDLELARGNAESAVRLQQQAVARDPLYADIYGALSWALIRSGQVPEAIAAERKLLELQPGYVWASTYLAAWLLVAGDPNEALAAAQREDRAIRSSALAMVHWALGRKSEADVELRTTIATQSDSNAYGIAWQYAYRGNLDEAFKWLERAYALKDPCLYAIKGEPMLANLKVDPRYKAFLRKMNLPE